jgi:hypothetical protein
MMLKGKEVTRYPECGNVKIIRDFARTYLQDDGVRLSQ